MRIASWTPPTPARDSASGTSDGEAWRSCVTSERESRMAGNATEDTEFARLVMLACHDLRTPLATVLGFTQTLTRLDQFEEPASRYLEMIGAAPVLLGEDLRDLGAAIAVRQLRAQGDLLELDGETLRIRFA